MNAAFPSVGPSTSYTFRLFSLKVVSATSYPASRRRRFGHLPGRAEAGAACGRSGPRHQTSVRPSGRLLSITPRIGPLEPPSGCSRVVSVVLCDGKDGCSGIICSLCRTTRIFHRILGAQLELQVDRNLGEGQTLNLRKARCDVSSENSCVNATLFPQLSPWLSPPKLQTISDARRK